MHFRGIARSGGTEHRNGRARRSIAQAEHSVVSIGAGTAWRTKTKPGQSNVWTDAQRRNGAMRSLETHREEMVAD